MEVKLGSVVQLKSGGPHMTVTEIFDGKANCIWFEADSQGLPHNASFSLDVLIVVDRTISWEASF